MKPHPTAVRAGSARARAAACLATLASAAAAPLALGAALASPLHAGEPAGFEVEPVLLAEHPVPGFGRVEQIFSVSVGTDDTLLVTARTSSGAVVLLADGELVAFQGQPFDALPPGETLAFLGAELGSLGLTGAVLLGSEPLDPDSSGVVAGELLLARRGDPVLTPQLPAGTVYASTTSEEDFRGVAANASDQLLVRAEVLLPGEVNSRGAFLRWRVGPDGVATEELLLLEGARVPGGELEVAALAEFPADADLDDTGRAIFAARAAQLSDDVDEVYVDGERVLSSAEPVPGLPGATWGELVDGRGVIDAHAGWAYVADLFGGVSDGTLVMNGALVASPLEAQPPAGLPLTTVADDDLALAGNGNLAWHGRWSMGPFSSADGLFLNRSLAVGEGVTSVGGVPIAVLSGVGSPIGLASFDLTGDGQRLVFTAELADGTLGVFALDLDPWVDLGESLAGTGGAAPALVGSGPMTAGSEVRLALSDARPGASAALVLGGAELGAAFKGGTLVPAPEVLLAGLTVGADGALELGARLPDPLASGLTLYAQVLVADPGAPAGLALSNAVVATTL